MEGFNIKESIAQSRNIKQHVKEEGIDAHKNIGKEEKKFTQNLEDLFNGLIEKNQAWISKQEAKICEILPDMKKEDIENAYMNGLVRFFKLQYKVFQKEETDEFPQALKDPAYVEGQIAAYTFDFIQTIKNSKKDKLTQAQTLHLAAYSYRNAPDLLQNLIEKYPSVTRAKILNAVFQHHRQGPETYIKENLLPKSGKRSNGEDGE